MALRDRRLVLALASVGAILLMPVAPVCYAVALNHPRRFSATDAFIVTVVTRELAVLPVHSVLGDPTAPERLVDLGAVFRGGPVIGGWLVNRGLAGRDTRAGDRAMRQTRGDRRRVPAQTWSMKVTRNTPEQLVLDYIPWLWAIAIGLFTMVFVVIGLGLMFSGDLLGIAFFLIGGGVGAVCLVVFVERLQVVLNRQTNKLRIRRRTLRGYTEEIFALDTLRRAVVETSQSSDSGTTSRPTLVLDTNGVVMSHPITQVYTSGNGATRAVGAINTWLETSEGAGGGDGTAANHQPDG